MKNKKLKLADLSVSSFVTSETPEKIYGGQETLVCLTGMSESTCMTNTNCRKTIQVDCVTDAINVPTLPVNECIVIQSLKVNCLPTINRCLTGTETQGFPCE